MDPPVSGTPAFNEGDNIVSSGRVNCDIICSLRALTTNLTKEYGGFVRNENWRNSAKMFQLVLAQKGRDLHVHKREPPKGRKIGSREGMRCSRRSQ